MGPGQSGNSPWRRLLFACVATLFQFALGISAFYVVEPLMPQAPGGHVIGKYMILGGSAAFAFVILRYAGTQFRKNAGMFDGPDNETSGVGPHQSDDDR